MPLPLPSAIIAGSLWEHKGRIYETDGTKWTIFNRDLEIPSFKYAEISEYVPPQPRERSISPILKRGRGRPSKPKANTTKREPTKYNLFVKEQMLAGAFSDLSGQERLKAISKMYMELQ
jgi:hypothetical protein